MISTQSQERIPYMGVDRSIAEVYGNNAVRRGGNKAVIFRIAVPNALIEDLKPAVISYGDEWKNLVFCGRRCQHFPKEFGHISSERLIIGLICHMHNSAIEKLQIWDEITVSHVMKITRASEKVDAIQYAFQKEGTIERLENEVDNFEIIPVINVELSAVRKR